MFSLESLIRKKLKLTGVKTILRITFPIHILFYIMSYGYFQKFKMFIFRGYFFNSFDTEMLRQEMTLRDKCHSRCSLEIVTLRIAK